MLQLRIWYTSFDAIDFYVIGSWTTKNQHSPGRIGACWRLWAHAKLNNTPLQIMSMILGRYTKHVAQNWICIRKTSECIPRNNEVCLRTHIAPPPAGPTALNNEAKLIESPLAAPLLSWGWINKRTLNLVLGSKNRAWS